MPEIIWAKFFKTRLTIGFTVKSDLRSESLKRIFSIIVLSTICCLDVLKRIEENYLKKAFEESLDCL